MAWESRERAARALARLGEEAGLDAAAVAELDALCDRSADPDGALAGAARALAARKARCGRPARRETLAGLVAICAASKFLASHLAARPRLLDVLGRPARLRTTDAREPAALLHRRLRRFKVREVLRIALADLSGAAPLREVTRDLSRLAAAAFEESIRYHAARLVGIHGAPEGGRVGFCVLGMGKLGGEELNFSSDVDVLYLYDRDGRTAGGSGPPVTHLAFYARLAEEVTRAIGAVEESGFVFRVDLDLRPEGRSGPIVSSIRGLEAYYEAQGAGWERFALLKARPIAGTLEVGEEALHRLAPFVWRKYLHLGAIEEMRQLKARAQREAARRGGQDLKLGPGGIREVEFFVQALQLLHGGKDAHLRERGTLRALDRLLFAGLLASRDRDELAEAYVLLRRLEHRVQMVAERQTHQLPDDAAERERLARRAGYPDLPALEAELALRRGQVEARFDDLLRVAGGGAAPVDERAEKATDPAATEEERAAALLALGFAEPEASAAQLLRLARRRGTPFSPTAVPEVARGAPALLAEIAAAPDPDQALRHLADLFGQLAAPTATAELLVGSPRTARLLASLFGSSDFLSRSLLQNPELIDQLVHRGSAPLVRGLPELRAELGTRLPAADLEMQLGELRRFKSEQVLRIGLHDVAGAIEIEDVSAQLSDLADACVAACLEMAAAETIKRDGPSAASLVVVGLGKLGGRELGYHSDLDLLFLYSGPGQTAGGRSNHEHFARIAQRLISHLTLPLREGPLYRIDTRLRPSGSAGPLVVSFDALADYHKKLARLWERQALLRARPVAGDEALFERARREVLDPSLYRPVDAAETARELYGMRTRMEKEIAEETTSVANAKLGRGGLVDVEFAAQYLQLVHGEAHPGIRTPSTREALKACVREGLLAPAGFEALSRGYRFLRRLEGRLRIVRDRPIDQVPRSGRELSLLARRLGYAGPRAPLDLLADYEQATAAVREAFLRVLGVAV